MMIRPAAMLELLNGIDIRIPVIAMNGAVLYDIKENRYIDAVMLENDISKQAEKIISDSGMNYFLNTLFDNTLIIYYSELKNYAEKTLFNAMSRSAYRNYTRMEYRADTDRDDVLYIMVLDEKSRIDELYEKLCSAGIDKKSRIELAESKTYEGYVYMKIFNKNVSKANMLEVLKKRTGFEKTVTFGSIKGAYDIYVDDDGVNSSVRMLKRLYEPFFWEK